MEGDLLPLFEAIKSSENLIPDVAARLLLDRARRDVSLAGTYKELGLGEVSFGISTSTMPSVAERCPLDVTTAGYLGLSRLLRYCTKSVKRCLNSTSKVSYTIYFTTEKNNNRTAESLLTHATLIPTRDRALKGRTCYR